MQVMLRIHQIPQPVHASSMRAAVQKILSVTRKAWQAESKHQP